MRKKNTQVDAKLTQKFHVVFWDQDGEDALITCIQDCPCWPVFVLSESPSEVLKGLGDKILNVDWYDLKH